MWQRRIYFFPLWNRPLLPALVSSLLCPCQGPWAHGLGKGQVCATAGDSPGMWGGKMPSGSLVLGSSFVLFWEMAMLAFFCPAEEVWASSGKHHGQLWEGCGSKIGPCPFHPNSRICMKSQFQKGWFEISSHWFSLNFWVLNPPISPKSVSWAGDSVAQPHSLYLELFIQEDSSGRAFPSPCPKRKVCHTPALQQKYYSVNTMALGMSMEKVKKPEVKRKA